MKGTLCNYPKNLFLAELSLNIILLATCMYDVISLQMATSPNKNKEIFLIKKTRQKEKDDVNSE